MNAHDWAELERDLAAVLPAAGAAGNRTLLLERLRQYSRLVVAEGRHLPPVAIENDEYTHAIQWLLRPVFVCGHHRSGTTLLQQLLDGHPELLVLPSEGTYFTSFGYAVHQSVCPPDVDRFIAEWICRFVSPNRAPHFKLGRSHGGDCPSVLFARRLLGWHGALLQRDPARREFALLLALAAAWRDIVAPDCQPRRWVEKTPRNECFVNRLRAFPEARFMQVVRHPAATLASMLALDPSAHGARARAAGHARRIANSMRLATRLSGRHGGDYLVVRYEDLTGNAPAAMERVREFLGIAPATSLKTPSELGVAVSGNSSFSREDQAGEVYLARAAALEPRAAQLLSAYAAAAAQPFAYDLKSPRYWRRLALRVQGAAAEVWARACRARASRERTQSRSNSAR